ncbi:hypothetical protein FKP32DRAFT_277209 [Trametes sanguinea]|nr:hypothetical protein FKP32DRAFT_277209 [Trametes sanguinea]
MIGSAQPTQTGSHTASIPSATPMPSGLSSIPTAHARPLAGRPDLTISYAAAAIIIAAIIWWVPSKVRPISPVKPRINSASVPPTKLTSLSQPLACATATRSPPDAPIGLASLPSSKLPSSPPSLPCATAASALSERSWYYRVKEWLAQCFYNTATHNEQNNTSYPFCFPFSIIFFRESPSEPMSSSVTPTISTNAGTETSTTDEPCEDEDEESVIHSALRICDCGNGAPHNAGLHDSPHDRDVPQGRQVRIDSWTFPQYQVDEPTAHSDDSEPLPIRVEGPPPSPTSSVSSISSPTLVASAGSSDSDTDVPSDTSLDSDARWRWNELTAVDPSLEMSARAVATRDEEELIQSVKELPAAFSTPVKGRAAATRRGLDSISSMGCSGVPTNDDDSASSTISGSSYRMVGVSNHAAGEAVASTPSWVSHVFEDMAFP